MPLVAAAPPRPFQRDRYTWLAYGMLGYFAYLQAALGPAIPFLRAELALNYTLSGLHFSAFAFGMMLSGLATDGLAARYGRARCFWGGALGMGLMAFLLALSRRIELTLLASAWMGLFGMALVIMVQATLSEKHGHWRGRALTEANIAAGITAGAAPLLVGLGAGTAFGWRGALALALALCLLVYFGARRWRIRIPMPAAACMEHDLAKSHSRARGSRLPRRFWLVWLVLVCVVAMEWCVIYWAAVYLEESVGLARPVAASALSVLFLGGILARFAGSQLTRFYRSERLLGGALLISAGAFPLFWLGGSAYINLLGLFLLGLGLFNLFPFALVLASEVGQETPDLASARISFANGLAIFLVPQLLGALADAQGLTRAYGIVVVLLALSLLCFMLAGRVNRRAGAAQRSP